MGPTTLPTSAIPVQFSPGRPILIVWIVVIRTTARPGAMVPAMTQPIRRVAVLGAGVMGSGIAAHCANAGIPVVLLDIVPPKISDKTKAARDAFATGALDKLRKAKPAAFMHTRSALLISTGNFEDDLARVGECDL